MQNKNIASISQCSYNALIWNYLGSAVRMSSQFIIGIILARLLGPEAFGVVAIGWLMVGIGNLVADFGLSAAVIQSETLAEKDIRFAFTAQVIFGALLTLIGFFSAEYIALFYHHVEATPVIKVMAFLFILQSFGQTAGAVLRRELNFKAYQAISIASYLIGYLLIGIPCAYNGFGAWSLVTAQLAQSTLFSAIIMWHTKHSLKPTFKPQSQGLFGFGGKVIAANIASWGISNIDSLVVGRVLGVANLGVYNRAMVLIATPMNTLTTSLQGVLFSASARSQTDILLIKKAFIASTSVIGLICLPLAITVASVPNTIVRAVYGDQWAAVIPVLPALAIAMAINAFLALIGPVIMAQNKVGLELRAQVISLIAMVPILYFTAQISLQAIAWGMVAIYLLRWFLLANSIVKTLHLKFYDLLEPLFWPLICAVTIATSTFYIDSLLLSISHYSRLITDMVTATITMFILLRFFGKKIFAGAHGEFLLKEGRIPSKLCRLIGL